MLRGEFDKLSISEVVTLSGVPMARMSAELEIPYRTIQDWKAGKRKCPAYVKLMIGKHYGLINGEI